MITIKMGGNVFALFVKPYVRGKNTILNCRLLKMFACYELTTLVQTIPDETF